MVNQRVNRMWKTVLWLAVAATFSAVEQSAVKGAIITRNIGVILNAANSDDYGLDVDQNGTNDFTFQTAYVPDPVLTVGFDQIAFPFGSINGVVIDAQTGDGFPATSVLIPGSSVSASSLFTGANDLADLYYYDTIDPPSGNYGGKTGFVGFRFNATDGTHYGYVQVSVKSLNDPAAPFNLTIGTVAYDNVAGTPVTVTAVPEPSCLAMFASAVLGLTASLRLQINHRA